ncbi:TPM domain-containing protein [Xylanivirga thermophila]|uniref:TPM domain-containing protein n=1 Tax=Xylanivirga thermophila TaxID=2496273 RepID=UPI00101DF0F4|nr:TPM domain-containing protein [Xylanivirga thermophila]
MKKSLLVVLLIAISILPVSCIAMASENAIPSPTKEFYINDYADVLDSDTEEYILNHSMDLERQTGAQIVVLTIDSLNDEPLEDFSIDVLRSWGIGQKDEDNGVLILLVAGDRKSRIEVGYGLEGALTDGKTGRIQDEYMLPYFKSGDYSSGILEGYRSVLMEIYKEYDIEPEEIDDISPQPAPSLDGEVDGNGGYILLFVVIVLLLDRAFLGGALFRFLMYLFFSGRGGPRGGGSGWSGGGGGSWGGNSGGGGSGGGGGSSRSW